MRSHTLVYFNYFGIEFDADGSHDFIACEICGKQADDIMHIIPKSRGGKDVIENLMAGCRPCHDANEGRNIEELQAIHLSKL